MQDSQPDQLLQAIKELTAEIRRMIERIRKQLSDMGKKSSGKSANGKRKRRGKP